MERKPKEPGGCCLFQMLFVLALTILAYNLYHWIWPDLRHDLLDKADLAFTFDAPVEERGPLAYGRHEDRKLFIYRSEDAPEDALQPVLVFFHGGGWSDGDPASYGFIGRNFAPRGFVVVNVGYRLLPEGKYPAMLADSAAALRWTTQNIAKYGGDPERIYLMGHSAGAYNAVMLGLDRRWTRRLGLPDDTIDGVIGLAGPYDFLPLDSENTEEAFGEARPLAATQPVRFARADAPPMLLATGFYDESVERENSEVLFNALAAKGARARHVVFNDMGHAGILMTLARPFDNDARVKDEVTGFLRERVREGARERIETRRRLREARATGEPAPGADEPQADVTDNEDEASGDIQPSGG
ncbi:alpha/beta hydrolase [Alteriqipengyuania lutimaris]|nr:alpha/beta hydrolase [Alteriqipengyuania lutimaris]MBB3034258.1 acetyl esterase/lipase [Alteriqipengyuania lutimaris]